MKYRSVVLLTRTEVLRSSPSDVPGTPGTHPDVPRSIIKALLCAPVAVDLMVHKWGGLFGFLSHLQPHMAPIFLLSHTHIQERCLAQHNKAITIKGLTFPTLSCLCCRSDPWLLLMFRKLTVWENR